jgi:hypothetical protein
MEARASTASARAVAAQSLHRLAQAAAAECAARRRRWADLVTKPGALQQFGAAEVEVLLVQLGRCRLVEPLRAVGLNTGTMLLQTPEAALLRVPSVTFVDARTLKLAAAALEAGAGVPAWLTGGSGGGGNGGCVENPSRRPRAWSAKEVAQHLRDARGQPAAAAQCESLGMTGAVLLSLSAEEVHLHQVGGGDSAGEAIRLGQELVGVVADLKRADTAGCVADSGGGRGSGAGAGGVASNPSSSSGSAAALAEVAAEDARLGAAVVQALLDHVDVKSGAPRPPPPQFPLSYLRRCTHGFDAAHEIGTGGFSTVCV